MNNEIAMEKGKKQQAVQDINLNYVFNLVSHIVGSASQAGLIADNFIKKYGQEQMAEKIYRDQAAAKEAAHLISEVAKLKSAYFNDQKKTGPNNG